MGFNTILYYKINRFSKNISLIIINVDSSTTWGSQPWLVQASTYVVQIVLPLPRFTKADLLNSFRHYSTNSSVVGTKASSGSVVAASGPEKIYRNAERDQALMIKENKGKCGVYR